MQNLNGNFAGFQLEKGCYHNPFANGYGPNRSVQQSLPRSDQGLTRKTASSERLAVMQRAPMNW